MSERTLRGKAAIVGVGETEYFKRGQAPHSEFRLALEAIVAACADAGVDPRSIDGLVSYHNERSDSVRVAAALGIQDLSVSLLQWGGGGGGGAAAIGHAASAIASGLANRVVVYRSLAQGQYGRYGAATTAGPVSGDAAFAAPYGLLSPAQRFALPAMRFVEAHKIERGALRAIAMASYQHAQLNARAVMHGRPLTEAAYDDSRWIAEPHRVYDCCMENDGAAAVLLTSAADAHQLRENNAVVLAVAQGCDYRAGARLYNAPEFATAGFRRSASRLYETARMLPADMDFVQCYENFTAGVLMALVEHALFDVEEANAFLTVENLTAPGGRLPLNTSGGNLAECYMHGMELIVEAVRQLRGESTAQVPGAKAGLVISGPMVAPTSSLILGTEDALH